MNRSERLRCWLREAIEYEPADLALFETALTHRSADGPNNERLEFLGDAVLGMITAQYLFERFTDADEGALSRLRARVVNGEYLAQLAAGLELGELLSLGQGELKTGGYRRESILADALEALCGALYLDAGLAAARVAVLRLLAPALDSLTLPAELKDPKTRLQEALQAHGLALPVYTLTAAAGDPHLQSFTVTCEVPVLGVSAVGEGGSRRRAEQLAAAKLLELLPAQIRKPA